MYTRLALYLWTARKLDKNIWSYCLLTLENMQYGCVFSGWKQISCTKASAFCLMSLSRPCTGRGKPRKAWRSLYRSHWDRIWGRLWQLQFVRHDTRDVGAIQGSSRTLQGASLRLLLCAKMDLHRLKCHKARLNAIIGEL